MPSTPFRLRVEGTEKSIRELVDALNGTPLISTSRPNQGPPHRYVDHEIIEVAGSPRRIRDVVERYHTPPTLWVEVLP